MFAGNYLKRIEAEGGSKESKMNTIIIYGDNRHEIHTAYRAACRGIVISGDEILLSYETKEDQWMIPGGGLEEGENLEDCCVRELEEETGYQVKAIRQYLTIKEYYEEWLFESFYFLCEVTGEGTRSLTKREIEVGLEPRWIKIEEARRIFSEHQNYAETDEMRRGMYLREYRALEEVYHELSLV